MSVLVLHDPAIGSHDVMAELYAQSIRALGQPVILKELGNGGGPDDRVLAAIHITIGPRFEPLPGVTNVAVVHHEWSRYPAKWLTRLDAFDEVWVTSDHTAEVLRTSGLRGPAVFMPPALDVLPHPLKTTWAAHHPFRFVACGEAIFRKGFHLLLDAYGRAFPDIGKAMLTIKTSAGCAWQSPRPDVTLITEHLPAAALSDLYRESDVLVSASLGEGLGLPVAEAMLVGLPVAANLWGGHLSLVAEGGAFVIPHRIVDQVFCSTPEYHAPGQQCALSDPDEIAQVLRTAFESSSEARMAMAGCARDALLTRYGQAAALAQMSERLRSWTVSQS